MKKFAKRSICFILALVLLFPVLPAAGAGSEDIHRLSIGLNAFFETGGHNDLLERSGSAHLNFVENMRKSKIGTLALKVLSFIYDIGVDESGTEPDEAKYMEVLVNIMKTYEMENADAISKQLQMDNTKGIKDLAWDALDIGISLIPDIPGTNKDAKQLGELIKTTMSGLAKVAKNTDGWIDAISNLETLIQDYAKFDSFLALVESNGECSLKSAASKLRNCMANAMEIRLETYCDRAGSDSVTYTRFFFEDVFLTVLKQTDLYEKDSGFAGFVDIFGKVNKLWCGLNLGIEIGKFVGNITVGAEDVVNRTLEMKAIYDITRILEDELWFIYHTFTSNYTKETDTAAEKYISYGNYLISCRIRGEYCLYSMLAKDSILASKFDDETAIAAEKQYNRLTAQMADLKEKLDSIPRVLVVDVSSKMPYEAVNAVSEWNVYGTDGELYDNYTLRIYDKQSLHNFVHIGPVDEPDPTVTEYMVDRAEPLSITLEYGYAYTFEFIDNENPENTKIITVGVTTDEQELIDVVEVETPFGDPEQMPEEKMKTLNAMNTLLHGLNFNSQESEISLWDDESISMAIWSKLNREPFDENSSYSQTLGIRYQRVGGSDVQFDLDEIRKLTQDTFGREFPDNVQSELLHISGNKVTITRMGGEEGRNLSVQDYVKQGDQLIAVGVATGYALDYTKFLGNFQAVFRENPSSVYGYTLVSLGLMEENQNLGNLTARASSVLREETITYYAENVLDGDLSTSWVEGVPGTGVNEWIKLETADGSNVDVSAITFSVGYQKNDELFKKNGRPDKVLIECEGGYRQEAFIYGKKDTVVLDRLVKTSWIKITILEAHAGTQYDDTCICEIRLHGIDTTANFQEDLENDPIEDNSKGNSLPGQFLTSISELDTNAIPISSAQEFVDKITSDPAGNYYLTADIDLSTFNNGVWRPICSWKKEGAFSGTLDGQGHVIQNLYIPFAAKGGAALFDALKDATIKNLGIEAKEVSASTNAAILAISGSGTVYNCYVTCGKITSQEDAGGLVSRSNDLTLQFVSIDATIECAARTEYDSTIGAKSLCCSAGGVAAEGSIRASHLAIHCDISLLGQGEPTFGYMIAGGVIGDTLESSEFSFEDSTVSCTVKVTTPQYISWETLSDGRRSYNQIEIYAGGLIGKDTHSYGSGDFYYDNSIMVSNCKLVHDISIDAYGAVYAGGFIGSAQGRNEQKAVISIDDSSLEGKINISVRDGSGSYAGGILGNCYADTLVQDTSVTAEVNAHGGYYGSDAGKLAGYGQENITTTDSIISCTVNASST